MNLRLALVGLLVVGACNDARRTKASHVEKTGPAAVRAATTPTLLPSATPSIDNIDRVPEAARQRLETTVLAIVENRSMDFVDSVSTGGFTIGSLAMTRQQTEAELSARSVAELTNVACASVDACRWSVVARGANELELEARANGRLVGSVELMHEDDGSWGVAGARPAQTL